MCSKILNDLTISKKKKSIRPEPSKHWDKMTSHCTFLWGRADLPPLRTNKVEYLHIGLDLDLWEIGRNIVLLLVIYETGFLEKANLTFMSSDEVFKKVWRLHEYKTFRFLNIKFRNFLLWTEIIWFLELY